MKRFLDWSAVSFLFLVVAAQTLVDLYVIDVQQQLAQELSDLRYEVGQIELRLGHPAMVPGQDRPLIGATIEEGPDGKLLIRGPGLLIKGPE